MLESKKDLTKCLPPTVLVEQYSNDVHYFALTNWFMARKLPPPPRWALSSTGAIVPDVAAGFLYLTNSDVGYFDGFISNPDVSKERRELAFDLIVNELLMIAANHNVKLIVCQTKHKAIERLTTKFGFTGTGEERVYSKRLCP